MIAALLAAASVLSAGPPANASTSEDLRTGTAVVSARVEQLVAEYARRSAAASRAADALAEAFGRADGAQRGAAAAADRLTTARAARSRRVRELYVDGVGADGALSLLTAATPDDALWRTSVGVTIQARLLRRATDDEVAAAQVSADRAAGSQQADGAAEALSRALGEVRDQQEAAEAALTTARALLQRLDAQARRLAEAQAAARALARAERAATAQRLAPAGHLTALGIPAEFEAAYRQAAVTCPGMEWTLLAAVGQVESGHGRNDGPSSAGAIGPMQFMPATFAAYAVDGDHDGTTDPWDTQDAVFTAARYLCSGGAGTGPDGVHAALLHYNHAEWYVDLVLRAKAAIEAAATTHP
jgi:membrane-bound lytic murein transglycosylase B